MERRQRLCRRLSDEGISADDLAKEIQRTDAVVKVAAQIIDTANIAIDAAKLVADAGGNYENMLPMIEGKKDINNDQPALTHQAGTRKK